MGGNKRKADPELTSVPKGTKPFKITVKARQCCHLQLAPGLKFVHFESDPQKGHHKFKIEQNKSENTWKITFSNASTAKGSIVDEIENIIRDIHFKVTGYTSGIKPLGFYFDDKPLANMSENIPAIDDFVSFEVPPGVVSVDVGHALQEEFCTPKLQYAPQDVVFHPRFRSDDEVLAHAMRLYPVFVREGYRQQTILNWFFFSIRRGCRKLFTFINHNYPAMLLQRNQYNELPLHMALRSEKPNKLANLILEMMDQSPLIWFWYDDAGMSAVYLVESLGLKNLEEKLRERGLYFLLEGPYNTINNEWQIAQRRRFFVGYKGDHYFTERPSFGQNLPTAKQLFGDNYQDELEARLLKHVGQFEALKVLLSLEGTKVDDYLKDDLNPSNKVQLIHKAAERGFSKEGIRFIVEKGASINAKATDGSQPIHNAALLYGYLVIDLLVEMGADVNAKDNRGIQPIHIAACHGSVKAVEKLVEHGALVDDVCNMGFQPIHYAVGLCSVNFCLLDTVESLVARGASVVAHGPGGIQPLHLAVRRPAGESAEVIRFLLDNGASVHARTEAGELPIHVAHISVVSMLLKVGSPLERPAHEKKEDYTEPGIIEKRWPVLLRQRTI